jgi:putative aminopeptidase FrvX
MSLKTDPLEREAAMVVNQQVDWWVRRGIRPKEAAKAMGVAPGEWIKLKPEMEILWLELNNILRSPMVFRDTRLNGNC